MNDDALMIHIGYPKTGSTWLQEDLFQDPASGMIMPWIVEPKEALIHPDELTFDARESRAMFDAGFELARARGLVPVLSDEFLTGNPIIGRYDSSLYARRIKAVFPDARILILIREQSEMVLSSYREFVRAGGYKTLEEFIGARRRPGFEPICKLSFLEFHRLIEHYQELFGPDRVRVLPFEWLRSSPERLLKCICEFAGVNGKPIDPKPPRYVGVRGHTLSVRRALNNVFTSHDFSVAQGRKRRRVTMKLLAGLDRIIPDSWQHRKEQQLRHRLAEHIGDRYRDSNRRTGELIGIDLADLGYPC